MTNELTKPLTAAEMASELRDKVQEKVRAAFTDLIDPEQWAAMTKTALEVFTAPICIKDGWDKWKEGPSPLEQIIHEEIHAKFRAWLKEELCKPEWQSYTCGIQGIPEATDAVKQMVRELMPEIVTSAFSGFMQTAIEQMRQTLGNG